VASSVTQMILTIQLELYNLMDGAIRMKLDIFGNIWCFVNLDPNFTNQLKFQDLNSDLLVKFICITNVKLFYIYFQ